MTDPHDPTVEGARNGLPDLTPQGSEQVLEDVAGWLTMLLSASTRAVPPPVDFALGDALDALNVRPPAEAADLQVKPNPRREPGSAPVRGRPVGRIGPQPATVEALARILTTQRDALLTAAAESPRTRRLQALTAATALQPWTTVAAIVTAHEEWGSRPAREPSPQPLREPPNQRSCEPSAAAPDGTDGTGGTQTSTAPSTDPCADGGPGKGTR
jgi:hypothetical protein